MLSVSLIADSSRTWLFPIDFFFNFLIEYFDEACNFSMVVLTMFIIYEIILWPPASKIAEGENKQQ